MSGLALHHRFNADIGEVRRDGTRITLDVPGWKALAFTVPPASIASAIEALGGDGATVETLVAIASVGLDAGSAAARVAYYLERFRRARLMDWVARRDREVVVTFKPLASGFGLAEGPAPERAMTLSRFAYARRDGDDLVLESPETPCRAMLAPAGLDVLRPDRYPATPATDPLLALFWRAGFLEPAGEAESDARATWEFHDRPFHVASREGRDAIPLGGTYRFTNRFPAPPAIRPAAAPCLALPRPDEVAVGARSDRLAALMDRRRSPRAYGVEPMALETLSEFLFRVARVTDVLTAGDQELLARPFPSGGSIHEIEFWVAAGACRGLGPCSIGTAASSTRWSRWPTPPPAPGACSPIREPPWASARRPPTC